MCFNLNCRQNSSSFLLFFLLTVRIFLCLKIDEPFRSLFFPPSFSSSSFASFEMADYVIINDSNFLWDGTLYPLQCYSPLKFIRRSSLGVRLTYRFDTGVCSRKAILNGHEFVHYIICPNFFFWVPCQEKYGGCIKFLGENQSNGPKIDDQRKLNPSVLLFGVLCWRDMIEYSSIKYAAHYSTSLH